MIYLTFAAGDAAMASRLKQDLQAAGYTLDSEWRRERNQVLLAVLSPEANTDPTVQADIIKALDSGQHIIPVLAQAAELPKLIDHLRALDFSQEYDIAALRTAIEATTAPDTRLPLKVRTPVTRARNSRVGYWLAALALVWFIIGLILVGFYGVQAPREEYDNVATEAAVTIQALVERNLPRSTEAALNFPLTVQAAPTAQRPLLVATATAMAEGK